MNKWIKSSTRLAAVAGLTMVVGVGLATPSFADPNPGHTSGEGIVCGGIVVCGPFAKSQSPEGPGSNTLASANVAGLITTGAIITSANSNGANSTVNQVNVPLTNLATLTATSVTSQCDITSTGGVTGSSSIVDGQVVIIGGTPITFSGTPAPNTTVAGLTGIATVVLNRQTTAPDGTLTVDALFITLLNGQTIAVASSSCTPTGTGIPLASGTGLLLGGGLLALLVLGYVIKRRPFMARQPA